MTVHGLADFVGSSCYFLMLLGVFTVFMTPAFFLGITTFFISYVVSDAFVSLRLPSWIEIVD